ncbi:hypothetical protein BM525_21140 (plasmid) [Alteromonas mediterranea]|uniref:Peptidase S8/S53 domain-containing protein n=1 Tax=Alteromonas mediterranea TaxID=314275 RepID=A0AAC9JH20_9ALTE|nr:S8 family serine peptidase [Alteromonas mediterranea]APD92366.1 hypothetical protein BM524_20920 [Alteromonas mediterranea]APE00227.1 hypothetical protein BM525_21140 [Alteromonas mediterranea]
MKNVKRTMMAAAISLVTAQVFAETDNVRLVVSSYKDSLTSEYGSVSQSSATNDVCVNTPALDAQWCVNGEIAKGNGHVVQSSVGQRTLDTRVVELESYGYSASFIAEKLRETGQFDEVVVDVPVTHSYSFTQTQPIKTFQDRYFGDSSEFPSGSNVYGAADLIGTPSGDNVDVLVLDSSFYDTDDVVYHPGSGRSFVTASGETPNDDYRPRDTTGCDGHGLSVAGIVGGTIDNGKGGDGVTNAVNIHPIRVMTCGEGYLSDVSRALLWADDGDGTLFSGDTSEASPYEGKVGIINISLSGYTGSPDSGDDAVTGCPIYMQEAINALKAKGWGITVGAGNNYGAQANEYSPANCEGVITVGALESSGDKASFSNAGDVTVAAHGVSMITSCGENDDNYCTVSGTSMASPLVAGIMAMVKQHTNADMTDIEVMLKATASKSNFGTECETMGCGEGLVDAKALLEAVMQQEDGELNTISFALNEGDECDVTWFVENFGQAVKLCELYSVKFMGGIDLDDTTYKLISVPKGQDLSTEENQTMIGEYESAKVVLRDIDAESFDYGVKMCSAGECGDVFEISTVDALPENKPVQCD